MVIEFFNQQFDRGHAAQKIIARLRLALIGNQDGGSCRDRRQPMHGKSPQPSAATRPLLTAPAECNVKAIALERAIDMSAMFVVAGSLTGHRAPRDAADRLTAIGAGLSAIHLGHQLGVLSLKPRLHLGIHHPLVLADLSPTARILRRPQLEALLLARAV